MQLSCYLRASVQGRPFLQKRTYGKISQWLGDNCLTTANFNTMLTIIFGWRALSWQAVRHLQASDMTCRLPLTRWTKSHKFYLAGGGGLQDFASRPHCSFERAHSQVSPESRSLSLCEASGPFCRPGEIPISFNHLYSRCSLYEEHKKSQHSTGCLI